MHNRDKQVLLRLQQGPGPRATTDGAATGTYNTFRPLSVAPPSDHDRDRDADELAGIDDHRPSADREAERRRPGSPHRQESRTKCDTGPTPASDAGLRGHLRGHGWSSGSQPPLPLRLPLPHDRQRGSRGPLAPLGFVACWRIHSPPLGRRMGLECAPRWSAPQGVDNLRSRF